MGFAGAIGLYPHLAELGAQQQAARARAEAEAARRGKYGDVIDVEATDITDRKAISDSTRRVPETHGQAQACLPSPTAEQAGDGDGKSDPHAKELPV